MLVTYKIAKYDQWLKVRDGIVFSFNCSCSDFLIRKLPKRETELIPCKHINQIKKMTTLKWNTTKMMDIGEKRISPEQKKVYRHMVKYKCQGCKLHEEDVGELQAHRIKRGIKGGTYAPNNVLMLCSDCHKKMHEGEFT